MGRALYPRLQVNFDALLINPQADVGSGSLTLRNRIKGIGSPQWENPAWDTIARRLENFVEVGTHHIYRTKLQLPT